MRWLKEHSLSLALLLMLLLQSVIFHYIENALYHNPSYWLTFWSKWMVNILGGTYGALVIVIFTKYFIERGSKESKE